MHDERQKQRQDVALFRLSVLGELIHLPPGHPGLYAFIRERAARDWPIPGSLRRRVAAETIRDWLQAYRRGGFDALLPKVRDDSGQSHRLPREVADLLLTTKEERPALSVRLLIAAVQKAGQVPPELVLAPSTVHRLLSRHGLIHPPPPSGGDKDHRRFSFLKAGELWMSDSMHGPSVLVGRQRRKTYLLALLDDATRVTPHAAFALSEGAEAYLSVLKTGLQRRGIPKRLFVDNGSAFRSHQLDLVCAKLGVILIHARPYHPEGKGKQERWFRTVRMQLLAHLTADDTASLEALNRRLAAWIEGEYHHTPHRGLNGDTPLDRWAQVGDEVRWPAVDLDLDDLFLYEAKRRVQKDRTVSLNGQVYEVDAALVGQTVTLRFDPSRRGQPIQVWHQGRHAHDARRLDAYANCFVKRERPSKALVAAPQRDETTDAAAPPAPEHRLRLADLERRDEPDSDEPDSDEPDSDEPEA